MDWDGETKTVTADRNGRIVKLTIGQNVFYVDSEEKTTDVPAQIMGGRTLVPVRAISESYDCGVTWDEQTKTVNIRTSEK